MLIVLGNEDSSQSAVLGLQMLENRGGSRGHYLHGAITGEIKHVRKIQALKTRRPLYENITLSIVSVISQTS